MTTRTYDPKCADLADDMLADHPHLLTEATIDAFAKALQKFCDEWIEDANANYDGAPYCSAGHRTKASCDCGEIARND